MPPFDGNIQGHVSVCLDSLESACISIFVMKRVRVCVLHAYHVWVRHAYAMSVLLYRKKTARRQPSSLPFCWPPCVSFVLHSHSPAIRHIRLLVLSSYRTEESDRSWVFFLERKYPSIANISPAFCSRMNGCMIA